MITHNGWDVTNIAYFYLNPLISVIPRVFPLKQNISSCPLSLQTTNQWYLSVWPFHWLLFDKSSVSVIWFIFTRGVKSERRDNWATRVILSSIPRAPGVTSSPPHHSPTMSLCLHQPTFCVPSFETYYENWRLHCEYERRGDASQMLGAPWLYCLFSNINFDLNKIRIDNYNCYAKYNRQYATQGYRQKPFKVKLTMRRKNMLTGVLSPSRNSKPQTQVPRVVQRNQNPKPESDLDLGWTILNIQYENHDLAIARSSSSLKYPQQGQ